MKVCRSRVVDAAEDIGEIRQWVDLEPMAARDQREQVCGGFAASVGACKKKILATKNEVLDCPLAGIVVDIQVRVLEEACERYPVPQGVRNGLHERVIWRMFALQGVQERAHFSQERLGFSSANGQPFSRRLQSNGGLNLVQVSIDIQDGKAVFIVAVSECPVVKELAARVSMASHFESNGVFEECIEAVCCIALHHTGVIFKKCFVSVEGLIWREIKDDVGVRCISDVGTHLALPHGASARGILYFDLGIVGFDDRRLFDFAPDECYELFCQQTCFEHPIRLSRARDCGFLAPENLTLAVERQPVCQLGDTGVRKQSRTDVTAKDWRHGFIGSNHVPPALPARQDFLVMHKFLECLRDALKLVCNLLAYWLCLDQASGTNFASGIHVVMNVFFGQVVRQNMLLVVAGMRFSRWPLRFYYADSRAGVAEFFVLGAELAALVFLVLAEKYVELVVEAFELLMEVSVGFQRQLQLLRQVFVRASGFSQLQAKRGQLIALPLVFLPEGGCLVT